MSPRLFLMESVATLLFIAAAAPLHAQYPQWGSIDAIVAGADQVVIGQIVSLVLFSPIEPSLSQKL